MKRILWAAALAVSALAVTPSRTAAFGIHPDCAHGFPWLQARVLNRFAWIHMQGPLYNYGPYHGGQGYVYRHYPYIAYHHGYIPAYPAAYYGQGGWGAYYQHGAAQPQHGAPAPRPAASPPQPSVYPAYLGQVWPGVQE